MNDLGITVDPLASQVGEQVQLYRSVRADTSMDGETSVSLQWCSDNDNRLGAFNGATMSLTRGHGAAIGYYTVNATFNQSGTTWEGEVKFTFNSRIEIMELPLPPTHGAWPSGE